MTFGPDNVLFVGDVGSATIFAIGTGDQATGDRKAALNIEKLDAKVAEMLGGSTKDFAIRDLKVNPSTGNVFLSVARTAGGGTILRIDKAGKITEQALKDIPCARFALSKLPKAENRRTQSITCLAFVKDRVFVAGLSNEEFNSTLRSIPFPFKEDDQTARLRFTTARTEMETAPRNLPTRNHGQRKPVGRLHLHPLVGFGRQPQPARRSAVTVAGWATTTNHWRWPSTRGRKPTY